MELPSNRPYLLRAIYEWIVDNNATPHVAIFAENPDVLVPQQFVNDGKIILNISPTAAQGLLIDNDSLSFSARFGGKPYNIYAPIGAIMALYASENGEGLSFDLEPYDDTPPDTPSPSAIESVNTGGKNTKGAAKSKKSKPPSLKVVK